MEPTPTVAKLEMRRQRLLLVAALGLLVWAGGFVASLWLLHAFSPWSEFLPWVWIVPGVAGWFLWQVPWTLLQAEWKDAVAVPAVAAWRPGWELFPGKGLPRKALAQSGLSVHPARQYYAEDLVRGTVEGVAVELAEVRASRSMPSMTGSGHRTDVLFQGVLGRASLGPAVEKSVDRWFVQPRGVTAALVLLPGRPVAVPQSPDFGRGYLLTWTGKAEAPAWPAELCDAVVTVGRKTGVKFRLAWDGSTLWMGTTSLVDLWEPPLWTRLDDTERLEKALRILEAFEALVKAFAGRDSPRAFLL